MVSGMQREWDKEEQVATLAKKKRGRNEGEIRRYSALLAPHGTARLTACGGPAEEITGDSNTWRARRGAFFGGRFSAPAPAVSKEEASLCRRVQRPMSDTLARPLAFSSTLCGCTAQSAVPRQHTVPSPPAQGRLALSSALGSLKDGVLPVSRVHRIQRLIAGCLSSLNGCRLS